MINSKIITFYENVFTIHGKTKTEILNILKGYQDIGEEELVKNTETIQNNVYQILSTIYTPSTNNNKTNKVTNTVKEKILEIENIDDIEKYIEYLYNNLRNKRNILYKSQVLSLYNIFYFFNKFYDNYEVYCEGKRINKEPLLINRIEKLLEVMEKRAKEKNNTELIKEISNFKGNEIKKEIEIKYIQKYKKIEKKSKQEKKDLFNAKRKEKRRNEAKEKSKGENIENSKKDVQKPRRKLKVKLVQKDKPVQKSIIHKEVEKVNDFKKMSNFLKLCNSNNKIFCEKFDELFKNLSKKQKIKFIRNNPENFIKNYKNSIYIIYNLGIKNNKRINEVIILDLIDLNVTRKIETLVIINDPQNGKKLGKWLLLLIDNYIKINKLKQENIKNLKKSFGKEFLSKLIISQK